MFGANIVKLGNRGQRVENDPVGHFSEGARLQERQLWSRQFEPLTNKANLFRIRRPADREGKRQEGFTNPAFSNYPPKKGKKQRKNLPESLTRADWGCNLRYNSPLKINQLISNLIL